tara:strand:+ start:250 stop:1422 length:1173 start_codon:yes stop_codon:yes gene_type:complete
MPLRPHQTDAVKAMTTFDKGQVIIPTGGGKTMCMIDDAKRLFNLNSVPKTIVVVAPRILLAEQLSSEFLEEIDDVDVMHVHSGETSHYSTTKTEEIEEWYHNSIKNILIFTTYHSLHRISDSREIEVDAIYFDEAHNSVQKNFFPATKHFSNYAKRSYFFTATPKHSLTPLKAGMNDSKVYGNVICQVPAPKLVDEGYILPPKVEVYQTRIMQKDEIFAEVESEQMLNSIDRLDVEKVLICAKSTKQIVNLVSQSDFCYELGLRGYKWMYITAKTGAIINGKKVDREEFFNTLNQWGKDDTRFVVLHHSILSEGINVSGLEAVLFMRNMDYISISQTIGRVIRLGKCHKTHGLVCVPVYNNVGISTARKVQAVVDTVFNRGEPAISVITR